MNIKSVYIEKFGGISDKRLEFNEGINIISAKNESGKSTIAEFIKIMLYGMGKSPQSIRQNERIRYMPWNEKRMGGEIIVCDGSEEYTIIRSFGRRKSDDTISAVNSVSGEAVQRLCVESPGELLLGVGREGFEKSLYIKQLSSKIESGSDDEILKKLVNLAQSGDEGVSFKRAVQILDTAAKDLNGTRPRGKMLLIQDEINALQEKRSAERYKEIQKRELAVKLESLTAQKSKLEAFSADKSEIEKKKSEYAKALKKQAESTKTNEEMQRQRSNRIKSYAFQLILAIVLIAVSILFFPLAAIAFGLYSAALLILFLKAKKKPIVMQSEPEAEKLLTEIEKLEGQAEAKTKENTRLLVDVAQQIGDIQNRLANFVLIPASKIDEDLKIHRERYNNYSANVDDIALAKECLQDAFTELQGMFGRRLNAETSKILAEITDGKYSEVLVDNDYNMLVRVAKTNDLKDAQYLSNGTYDQIYFALRMGIVNMLFENVPVILDEAFVQYDDARLKSALNYIKKAGNRQFLLFSCHSRESDFLSL